MPDDICHRHCEDATMPTATRPSPSRSRSRRLAATSTAFRPVLGLIAVAGLLGACGGEESWTQERVEQVVLTSQGFPLPGWERTDLTVMTEDSVGDPVAGAGFVDAATELSVACRQAVDRTTGVGAVAGVEAGAAGYYEEQNPADHSVGHGVVIAVLATEDDATVGAIEQIAQECVSTTFDDDGFETTLDFGEIPGIRGSWIEITTRAADVDVSATLSVLVAGDTRGGVTVVVTGIGVDDDELKAVFDTQMGQLD